MPIKGPEIRSLPPKRSTRKKTRKQQQLSTLKQQQRQRCTRKKIVYAPTISNIENTIFKETDRSGRARFTQRLS